MENIYKIFNDLTNENYGIQIKGDVGKKFYLITITSSKKKYNNIENFRYELSRFYKSMKLNGTLFAIPEFHNAKGTEDKLHCHGVYFGELSQLGPLKKQSKNQFKIHYVAYDNKPDTIVKWRKYMMKEVNYLRDKLNIRPACAFPIEYFNVAFSDSEASMSE